VAGHAVGAQTYTVALDAAAVMAGHAVGAQSYMGALDAAAIVTGHTVGVQTYTGTLDVAAVWWQSGKYFFRSPRRVVAARLSRATLFVCGCG
jgi:hypothetical protein